MVVTRRYDLVGLSIFIDGNPSVRVGVKQEYLVVVVIALQARVEDDLFGWTHLSGVMRDAARSTTRRVDKLPFA